MIRKFSTVRLIPSFIAVRKATQSRGASLSFFHVDWIHENDHERAFETTKPVDVIIHSRIVLPVAAERHELQNIWANHTRYVAGKELYLR